MDARVAVLDQLAAAYDRHSKAEEDDRESGRHKAAYEHHGAILLLTRMCKEAEAQPEHPHHTPIPGCPRCPS
jgi:hypothetical protein